MQPTANATAILSNNNLRIQLQNLFFLLGKKIAYSVFINYILNIPVYKLILAFECSSIMIFKTKLFLLVSYSNVPASNIFPPLFYLYMDSISLSLTPRPHVQNSTNTQCDDIRVQNTIPLASVPL